MMTARSLSPASSLEQTPQAPELTPEAPWPGPAAYTERDAAYFFGRQLEIADLHRLVRAEPLCVLYSVSGVGKTSLIRAGLFRRLNADGYLTVIVRLAHGELEPPLGRQVLDAAERAARAAGVTAPPWQLGAKDGTGTDTLATAFHTRGRFFGVAPQPLTLVLVFDQFEELFTQTKDRPAARQRADRFLVELSELLEATGTTAPIRVLIALREEHLASLESLRHLLPGVRRAGLRLLPFNAAQAREIVIGPGADLFDDGATDAIVETFAAANDLERATIEPVLLSLFCWQLNQQRLEGDRRQRITRQSVEAGRGEFLKDFYDQAFRGLSVADAAAVRKFVEDDLVDDAGYRTSAGMEHAKRQPGVTSAALEQLVQRRLLHPIDRAGGRTHLEIIHDRVAEVARQRRDERRAAEAADLERLLRARVRRTIAGAAAVIALILALFVQAVYQRKQAVAARQAADGIIEFLQYTVPNDVVKNGITETLKNVNTTVLEYYKKYPADDSELPRLREKSVALMEKGDGEQKAGHLEPAWKSYQEGLAIQERLVAKDPHNADAQRDLSVSHDMIGKVLEAQGNLDGALQAYKAGLLIREQWAAKDPNNTVWQRDVSVSQEEIGAILQAQGDLAGALQAYQKCLAFAERMAEKEPDQTVWQRDVSVSQEKIGSILQAQGDLAGALQAYQKSLTIREQRAAQAPDNTIKQRDLSVIYEKIGNVLRAQQQLADALQAYQKSLAIRHHWAAKDPKSTDWQRDVSVSQQKIGSVMQEQGDLAGALEAYQAGLTIATRLAENDPDNTGWQRDQSVFQEKVGDVLLAQGQLAGALQAYQARLAIAEQLEKKDPNNTGWTVDVAVARGRVAMVLLSEPDGDRQAARQLLREALAAIDRLPAQARSTERLNAVRTWLVGLQSQASSEHPA